MQKHCFGKYNSQWLMLLALLLISKGAVAQKIELNKIGSSEKKLTGISWGVPFAKSEVKKDQQFLLKADAEDVPVQSWTMAYWPDGSVKWMGMAATVPNAQKFSIEPVKKLPQFSGISVSETENAIIVSNDNWKYEIPKSGTKIISNIKSGNKILAENGRLTARLENRDKINSLTFENYISEIKNVEIEQKGSIRSVIKISGLHRSLTKKRELLPFDIRFYFHAGIPEIRVVHSFVFDGNQETDFIKGMGLTFDVPLRENIHNRHVRFSAGNGGLWSEPVKPIVTRNPFIFKGDRTIQQKQMKGERLPEITRDDSIAFTWFNHLPEWNDYKLTQQHSDAFTIQKRTNNQSSWLFANAGSRSDGLALLGDVSGGLAVSLKDFWQSYPASFEINNARTQKGQLTVWFWSPDADAMDLRHYDTVAHDLDATYEDVQSGLSTPYGIARTSEFTIFPFDKLPSKTETVQMASEASETQLLVCTPEYLHKTKAFGVWSLPDRSNETKNWIENQLDSAFKFYDRAVDEHRWYGFWNYGDVMHTYDPSRHVWRYDIGGFAWANTELAPNNWLWYSFLRTGRADIFRMAEAMTRHTGEVDAYHIGEMKGLGTRHNVSHWGCGAKEARVGQAAWKRFYYYLTTDERSGDLMRESLDAEKSIQKYEPLRIAQPRDKFPYYGPTRLRWGPDWLALAGNWMTEWERTGNIVYRNKILAGLESLSKLPDNLFTGPNGLSYDPATGRMWYDGIQGVTNKAHLPTIMGGYEILMEMFDMIDYKPFRKTFTEYCRHYSMPGNSAERTAKTRNWGDINFRTPRLTAFAARELNDDSLAARAWREFLMGRRLQSSNTRHEIYSAKLISGSETTRPVHENPFVSTNSTAQWGLNAIIMLELIGDKIPDPKTDSIKVKIAKAEKLNWKLNFSDNMKTNWQKKWFLDGEKASLTNSKNGLLFKAGPKPASDADHSVLWTKKSFSGDIKIEFDFVRCDSATRFVNIIYLFAEGSGEGAFDKDIALWKDLRKIPAMKMYFNHINAYHISFAAFENDNNNPAEDYVRARRYLPEADKGLAGTDLLPDNFRTGVFKPYVKYHISVISRNNNIFMKVNGDGKTFVCSWDTSNFPPLNQGRIGLRLMGSRISEFSDFKVYTLD
jgi:RNase P/RNase MRP subunit p29